MKTKLPKKSDFIKKRLDEIVKETLFVAKRHIAKIVLFGSYARGDWVYDRYVEDRILYKYNSDLDIMIVLKKPYSVYESIRIESAIKKRLEKKRLMGARWFLDTSPPVTLILEPIQKVNKNLEKKQYFFSDIIKEGILLYDNEEFTLAAPRELKWEEQKEIAQDYFDYWFPDGVAFIYSTYDTLKRNSLKIAAFQLHQAAENFYNTILLVLTGYKGKVHDLKVLDEDAVDCSKSKELMTVFPRDTEENKRLFELLKDAYVKARYDKKYKITEEELLYLIGRVEILKEITEKICKSWINQ